MNLTGTIQEVHAQLLKINPDYDARFAPILAKRAADRALLEMANATSGAQHRPNLIDYTRCGLFKQAASANYIRDGIEYLRRIPAGVPSMGMGCGKVSCSWGSAIYWCNAVSAWENLGIMTLPALELTACCVLQNNHVKTLGGWHNIADGAQLILDVCQGINHVISGGRFHADGWATVVKGTRCSSNGDPRLYLFSLDWIQKYEAGEAIYVRPPTSWEGLARTD